MRTRREFGNGICQRPKYRPGSKIGNLWESQRGREAAHDMVIRHQQARLLCLRCPLLEDCEDMVAYFERQNQPVDGVVAGRYSTVIIRAAGADFVHCRGCQEPLKPQHPSGRKYNPDRKVHAGEQFCEDCHPRFSRRMRARRE